ncbi:aldehyde dehydrogenase family protein [Klugiella xanthotipulae]|uniref:Acyl-CoA reductase-like NAD-dependent aldehyde dehydrogenase n=1 Tax=Klugiella xanthotipulae TaxID=244735 RepID=A0A543HH73_9MICO|nr:aldehyde dehydrogenase family protein [Klugiella xanthotipulae]TQM57685.1 acyl-CoA reductase-like NAD-dependent aldehyde dehydrogenase [Klugiella xanthotipulae]
MMTTTSSALGLQSHYDSLIDGRFQSAATAAFEAVNAATGEVLATISRGGAEDINAAVAAAKRAFPAWAATRHEERSRMLNRLADWVEANLDRLAAIDAADIGRPINQTPHDHITAVEQYRFFAGAILTHEGANHSVPGGWALTKREPIGVVGQIIPWNVPAIMVSFKIAPALAAGNTVVLKPDENASLSTLELCTALAKIFPAGVVNVVTGLGEEAGAALTAHPDVAKLAFTGSPSVGRMVALAGAERLVPVSLELGGKSPNIVFPDIENMDAVVADAAFAATYCNGQSCLAGTRLFVHDDLYTEFTGRLTRTFESMTVGSPSDPTTALGCLVSEAQGTRVLNYIDTGKAEANLLTGGGRRVVPGNEHGYFIEPTIFETDNNTRIAQEEIFGPVLSIIRWKDVDSMIEQANDIPYGLASGIYTSNLTNAMRTADRLQAGSVWVNQYVNLVAGSPFGGYKESGIGREFCADTLNMYSQMKSIVLAEEVPAPRV